MGPRLIHHFFGSPNNYSRLIPGFSDHFKICLAFFNLLSTASSNKPASKWWWATDLFWSWVSDFAVQFCLNYLIGLVLISDQNTKQESGRKVQLGNINAAKVSYCMFLFHILQTNLSHCLSGNWIINSLTNWLLDYVIGLLIDCHMSWLIDQSTQGVVWILWIKIVLRDRLVRHSTIIHSFIRKLNLSMFHSLNYRSLKLSYIRCLRRMLLISSELAWVPERCSRLVFNRFKSIVFSSFTYDHLKFCLFLRSDADGSHRRYSYYQRRQLYPPRNHRASH